MNPKEKAVELGNKFYRGSVFDKSKEEHLSELLEAKKCALIAVDEIIKEIYKNTLYVEKHKYWQEVKKEIEKL